MAGTRNQGEGDRESGLKYDEDQHRFVESGRVEEAARRASHMSEEEQRESEEAERLARRHAKEEDPEIHRDYSKPD